MTLRGIKVGFLKTITILMLTSTLVACGGSGGGSSDTVTTVTIPSQNSATSDSSGLVTVSGKAVANSMITVTFPDGSQEKKLADSNGNYTIASTIPQNSGTISISSDSQGNTSDPASVEFTANLDSTAVLKALYKATGVMPYLNLH